MSRPMLDIDTIVDHARRCDAFWGHRFVSLGYRDMWQAYLRDTADLAGITVGDRDQAAMVVASTLVVDSISAQLARPDQQAQPERRLAVWTPGARDAALIPAQITTALLLPYLEGGQ